MQKLTARSFGLLALVSALGVAPAFAQDSPSVNYATLAGGAKDGIISAMSTAAPVAFGVLVAALGIGLVWRLIKRGAKSV